MQRPLTLIDQTIGLVEANGDNCYMPELLRMKGGSNGCWGH